MRIESISEVSASPGFIARDILKIVQFWGKAVGNSANRKRLLSSILAYILLTPSAVSSFFIRGWRFALVREVLLTDGRASLPRLNDIWKIGEAVKQGVKLIGAKFMYDVPKFLILFVFAYDLIDAIIDWFYFLFFQWWMEPAAEVQTASGMVDATVTNFSLSFSSAILLYIVYSCFLTPAFKISEIKYAAGQMKYKGFFDPKELKSSFRLYRKYSAQTLEMYVYDNILMVVSIVIGLFFSLIFPPFILLIYPTVKLMLNHMPKYYGYALLAQRMQENGDIVVREQLADQEAISPLAA